MSLTAGLKSWSDIKSLLIGLGIVVLFAYVVGNVALYKIRWSEFYRLCRDYSGLYTYSPDKTIKRLIGPACLRFGEKFCQIEVPGNLDPYGNEIFSPFPIYSTQHDLYLPHLNIDLGMTADQKRMIILNYSINGASDGNFFFVSRVMEEPSYYFHLFFMSLDANDPVEQCFSIK